MPDQPVERAATGAFLRVPREDVLRVFRRFYGPHRLEAVRRALPDPVDVNRDAAALARFGLTIDDLYNAGGMSP